MSCPYCPKDAIHFDKDVEKMEKCDGCIERIRKGGNLPALESLFQCDCTGKTDSNAGRFPPFPDSFNTYPSHFSIFPSLSKWITSFRTDLFAGMTSNTFFFVCQYKSSLRIFVNCLHRTDFDTDTAVITARTDILFKLIFHYLWTVRWLLHLHLPHHGVHPDRLYDRHNSRHIYPDQILIGNSCLHLAFSFSILQK